MKTVGFALLAAMAVGCSASPTSPTTSPELIATMSSQDAKHGHVQTMKVTLYFYYPPGGSRLEGLPVTVAGIPDGPSSVSLITDKQGSVTANLPRTTERVGWEILPNADGVCPASGELVLPYGVKGNWFAVDIRSDCVAP